MKARRAYVTGAAGLIGKDVVRQLRSADWEVTAADVVAAPAQLQQQGVTWCVERAEDLSAQRLAGYDAVIHLGALTLSAEQKSFGAQVDLPDARPMLSANVLGTENVFRSSCAAKVPCVVYASTAAVYGRPLFHTHLGDHAVEATGPFRPTSLYAHSKLMCEGMADFYAEQSTTRFIGLRPTFSYGLGRLSGISGMFAAWIAQAIRGERAVLGHPFGLGGKLQLIYVKDMAQNFVDAAIGGAAGSNGASAFRSSVFNSATHQVLSMAQIRDVVRACTDNSDVHVADGDFVPQLQMPLMSTRDAFEQLGCTQRYPLDKAIADMKQELARDAQ